MTVTGVLLGGDGRDGRLREVICHHLGVALESAAGHDDAFRGSDAHFGASVGVDAPKYGLGVGVLDEGFEGALSFQGDGGRLPSTSFINFVTWSQRPSALKAA